MKKIYFTLVLVLFTLPALFAQYSAVRPLLITWEMNGHRVSLKKGLYGVELPSELTLSVYFSAKDAHKWQQRNTALQFRWYYYLSTRRKLIRVETVSFNQGKVMPDGSFVISSTLKTVQPGWWEVQIVSSADRRYISFAGLDRFQIFIRSRSYTMR